MDFAGFNCHTQVQNPGYAECYEEITHDLLDPVAKLNQEILLPNERNDSLTLYNSSHILNSGREVGG